MVEEPGLCTWWGLRAQVLDGVAFLVRVAIIQRVVQVDAVFFSHQPGAGEDNCSFKNKRG